MTLYLDIETNMTHDTIWCCVAIVEGNVYTIKEENKEELAKLIDKADEVVAHNGIRFDYPVLERVWGVTVPKEKQVDTFVLSRLYNPQLEGGHSLANWGTLLGLPKMDNEEIDFDAGFTEEMLEYCVRDTEVLARLHKELMQRLAQWKHPEQSIELEHKVAQIMYQQERNGFLLNVPYTSQLLGELSGRMAEIEAELQAKFPPIITERYSEKTGKRLKDDVEVFNIGSRQQIAKRLRQTGAKFTKTTEKGSLIVDETTLAEIDLPEAKLCAEYLMLQKRVGMINSWLEKVEEDDRVRGRVITNGAVTGRMVHSNPNLGQVTSVNSEYGKESRKCWIVPKGYKLVGCDLSGIELRCLAHYMQDDDWTKELLNGDIHTKNQQAAGLETRAQAKTFIYATLYGAGPAKIGSIAGGGRDKGKKLLKDFLDNTPALKKLKDKVERIAEKGYLPALDKRRLVVRSQHSALNTLLQSCGAIIAKQWLVEIDEALNKAGLKNYAKQVVMVHDEVQFEVKEEYAEQVGELLVKAANKTGEVLGFRVKVDAEYAIGDSWLDTH